MPPTRFAGLSRQRAIVLVAATLLATLCLILLALAIAQPDTPVDPSKSSDLKMYAGVVDHVRHGENFYDALRAGLSAGHYGMKSVFNWRTPFLMSVAALFPSFWTMQGLLILLALTGAVLACLLGRREANPLAANPFAIGTFIALELLCLGACLVPEAYLISELPAGFAILVSAAAYGLGWRRTGLAAGMLALVIRELAAPYIVVCAFLAWRDRRYRELAMWAVAIAIYGAYYLWHAHLVGLHQVPTDHGDPAGWVQFGGAAFVLNAAAFNGFFMAEPLWITAILLPAACIGLMAWPGPAGERIALTVFLYLAIFAIAGKSYNSYWGGLFTPLLSLGLTWLPAAGRDLWRVLRRTSSKAAPA